MPSARGALLDGIIFNPCGTALPQHLAGHPIVAAAWSGIDPARYWDCHVHIADTGDSGSGIYTSPDMNSVWHPVQFAQHEFYLNAACAKEGTLTKAMSSGCGIWLMSLSPVASCCCSPLNRRMTKRARPCRSTPRFMCRTLMRMISFAAIRAISNGRAPSIPIGQMRLRHWMPLFSTGCAPLNGCPPQWELILPHPSVMFFIAHSHGWMHR